MRSFIRTCFPSVLLDFFLSRWLCPWFLQEIKNFAALTPLVSFLLFNFSNIAKIYKKKFEMKTFAHVHYLLRELFWWLLVMYSHHFISPIGDCLSVCVCVCGICWCISSFCISFKNESSLKIAKPHSRMTNRAQL